MPPTYTAMPYALASRGWMVYNRLRLRPVAIALTPPQALTLAALLNFANRAG